MQALSARFTQYAAVIALAFLELGCGQNDGHVSTDEVAAQSKGRTDIRFRGVSFDKPGVEKDLLKICQEVELNVANGLCRFENHSMTMFTHYGSLGWAGGQKPDDTEASLAIVGLGKDQSLRSVILLNKTFHGARLLDELAKKYGVAWYPFKNSRGERETNAPCWMGKDGTVLCFLLRRETDPMFDDGYLTEIMFRSSMDWKDFSSKVEQEAATVIEGRDEGDERL